MTDLDFHVPVYEQEVMVSVSVIATSALMRLGHGLDQSLAKITIACSYQVWDEESCGLPATIEATLTVPLEELVEPEGVKTSPNALNRNRLQSVGRGNQNDNHSTYD